MLFICVYFRLILFREEGFVVGGKMMVGVVFYVFVYWLDSCCKGGVVGWLWWWVMRIGLDDCGKNSGEWIVF